MRNQMRKSFIGLVLFIIVSFLVIGAIWYDTSRPEYIEGAIMDKFIDFDKQDHFKFVILENDGKYQICQVTADQYYSHEVGDWFEGEVYYADDPDSGWD